MNTKPIENAHDADLRLSKAAMQRAAARARELARQTGTQLVIMSQGQVTHVSPESLSSVCEVREPLAGYGRNE